MDAFDLFKKLSAGTKFDKKRFRSDVEKFKNVSKVEKNEEKLIKTEPVESAPSVKRKHDQVSDDEEIYQVPSNEFQENKNTLVLLNGMSVPVDGVKVKKNKKQKVSTEEQKIRLEKERINHFRNKNRISVIGRHVPKPIESFDELGVAYNIPEDLLKNIKECNYSSPTPIQMQALPIMLEKRQLLACAPTGSGKTAAFLLPIIHHLKGPAKKGFRAVILNPTRELAKQTYRECMRLSEGRGFRIHIISKLEQALDKYGPKSSQKFDILITTPKRLLCLINHEPPAISLNNVEWLVIDEADKLFEAGTRGFRSQLKQISSACSNEKLRTAMFSATNTPIVNKWCNRNLKGFIGVTIGHRNAATDLVDQELLFVGSERGKLVAFRNIISKGMAPPVLVFVQSKERAQELFSELIYDGINVDVIHADRTQTQRDNVVRCFREGKIWVLICTELMSRGIDFKGVNLVINYDFPPSAISYVHRIGRTGRAGHKGKAITFFTESDTTNLRSIAVVMRASGCEVPDYMFSMKKHDKRERKKLERVAPKRDSISTSLKKPKKQKKITSEQTQKPSDSKKLQKTNETDTSNKEIINKKQSAVNGKDKNKFSKTLKKKKVISSQKINCETSPKKLKKKQKSV
ncbi:probable ATP-dependent RNA helicase DDX52 [Microplitis demolitor]|uniref:probable ATP-dependent RNA helicase DDX52 n=1 Tax=Microplitis demolitor TaxID=69319 RepID=UPI00235B6F28|nr:probable ATP-dependent RNA helicase DDX52 [Microplitis demolitor]